MGPLIDLRIVRDREGLLRLRIDGRAVRIPQTRDRGEVLALVADHLDYLDEVELEGAPIVEPDPVAT